MLATVINKKKEILSLSRPNYITNLQRTNKISGEEMYIWDKNINESDRLWSMRRPTLCLIKTSQLFRIQSDRWK